MMHVEFLTIFQVLVADRANALLPLDKLSAAKRGLCRSINQGNLFKSFGSILFFPLQWNKELS
jgi:hypothetical protein